MKIGEALTNLSQQVGGQEYSKMFPDYPGLSGLSEFVHQYKINTEQSADSAGKGVIIDYREHGKKRYKEMIKARKKSKSKND